MKRIAAAVTIVLCTGAALAGVSRSYKDWPKTPIGYYMTNDEKKQWSALQTDAEAERFIKDFIARRGGETFTREVAQNAEKADKYLSIGKTPGSETVRGKMMILLGPAAPASATKKKKAGEVHMAPGTVMGTDLSGPTMQDMQAATNDPGNATTFITEYTYTYPAAALPPAYGKALTVKIEVDPGKETDRLSSYSAEKELDKVYELAAQAKLAAAKPATP
ncbi:MAG: GWxTD domain-containing protein [Acidobacteria bacterium]|nr:GWxTD domain-containing protein [Acidobacteriota bacterium]MBV9185932.1 GWxTD domain-containing protein [Acidobacteriota bacterium]